MTRHVAVCSSVILLSLSFLGFVAGSQASGDEFVIRQEVRLVLVDAGVTDASGRYVSGLGKESFKVTENGRPYPITVFDNSDLPVTMGVLVDESGSMAPRRNDVIAAAETLIQEGNPRDEVFVLNFNDYVRRGLPESTLFSSDILQLRRALQRGVPQGRTAFYDAVMNGLTHLNGGRRERKALVVISDGGDTASGRKRSEMVAQLERNGATIYAIGLSSSSNEDADPGILRRLARISGGEVFFPEGASELTAACRRIAKAIRSRYVVGYRPIEGKPGELRHVRVQVQNPQGGNLTVLARTTYRYGDGPAAVMPGRTDATERQ